MRMKKRAPILLGPDAIRKATVLNKAALDAASELDSLSGHFASQIEGFDLANIKAIVGRVHDASEQLQPHLEVESK